MQTQHFYVLHVACLCVCMCSKRVRFCIPTSPVVSADAHTTHDADTIQAPDDVNNPTTVPDDANAELVDSAADSIMESEPVWIQTPRLYTCDKDDIQDPGRWLCDRVINAAQHFLRLQHPDAAGLCDTVTVGNNVANAQWSSETVQVMFDSGKHHWFTVSSIGCSDATVDIYDSMQSIPSDKCLKGISRYVRVAGDAINIRVLNVAKQTGTSDCGLFAIAFATALLNQQDPVNVVFRQDQMRDHLQSCFEVQRIAPFPVSCQRTVRRRCARQISVKLYCLCKTAYVNGEEMIMCNVCRQWYHPECVDIEAVEYIKLREDRSLKYTCLKCAGQ